VNFIEPVMAERALISDHCVSCTWNHMNERADPRSAFCCRTL